MTRNLSRLCRPEVTSFAWTFSFVVACFVAIPAQAGIISFSGVTPLAGPPAPSVLPGAQPVVPTPIVFRETGGAVSAGGLPVDHVVTGNMSAVPVVSGGVVNPVLVAGSIPAGTAFESYLFHFDPDNAAAPQNSVYPSSTIVFSNQILGVQLFSSAASLFKPAGVPYVGTLEAGDLEVAANAGPLVTYYPFGLASRGQESDSMAITTGGTGILLSGQAFGGEIDQVRILVAVPEPATLGMAFVAILGIMGLGRTRTKAARS